MDDVDPVAIRETLAQRGIVDGQVVNPEKLDSDPFVQQVMADAQRIAAEETPEQPTPPDLSDQPITRTGDTITIGNGEPVHEIDITVSDEEYEAIRQTIPEEKPMTPPLQSTMWATQYIWKIRVSHHGTAGGHSAAAAHRHELPHLPC